MHMANYKGQNGIVLYHHNEADASTSVLLVVTDDHEPQGYTIMLPTFELRRNAAVGIVQSMGEQSGLPPQFHFA
jgi:hypothetical protein